MKKYIVEHEYDGYEIGDDSALLELLSVNDNDIQNID